MAFFRKIGICLISLFFMRANISANFARLFTLAGAWSNRTYKMHQRGRNCGLR